jgi:hypothetical protein
MNHKIRVLTLNHDDLELSPSIIEALVENRVIATSGHHCSHGVRVRDYDNDSSQADPVLTGCQAQSLHS